MNHDSLQNMLSSAMMYIYKVLYEEYRNEDMAKRNAFKIAKNVLVDFGMRGDLYKTYESLVEEYKACKSEQQKLELYRKIEVLQSAIAIVKEANTVGGEKQ